jgi:hypothetical protein
MTATVSDRTRQIRQERGTALAGGPASLSVGNLSPDDVAPFAVYLASDAANEINGQTFLVMGGIVALLNQPAAARTITKIGRWTAEEIAALFPRTLGMDLVNPAPPQPPK